MTYTTKQKSRRAQLQKARQKRCFHRHPAELAEPDPSSQSTNQQGPATSTAGLATPSEAQHHQPGRSVDAATPVVQQHTREQVQQHAAHLLQGSFPAGASHPQQQPIPHPNFRHQLLSRYALTDPPPPQPLVYPAQHVVPPVPHARIPAVAAYQQQEQPTTGLREHTLQQQAPSPLQQEHTLQDSNPSPHQQQHTLQDSDPLPQQLLPSPQQLHLSPEQEPPRKKQRPNPTLPGMPVSSEAPGTQNWLGDVTLDSSRVQVDHHPGSYVPAAAAALLAGHATSPPPPPTVLQLLQPPPGVSDGTRKGFQVAAKATQSLPTPGGRHARAGINCSNADRVGPVILATRGAPISGIRHLSQQQKAEQQAAENKRLQQQVAQQQQQIKEQGSKLFILRQRHAATCKQLQQARSSTGQMTSSDMAGLLTQHVQDMYMNGRTWNILGRQAVSQLQAETGLSFNELRPVVSAVFRYLTGSSNTVALTPAASTSTLMVKPNTVT